MGKVRMAVCVQRNVPHNWTRVQESYVSHTLSLNKIIRKSKPYAYKGKRSFADLALLTSVCHVLTGRSMLSTCSGAQ